MDFLHSQSSIGALSSLLKDCENSNERKNENIAPQALEPTKIKHGVRSISKTNTSASAGDIWDDDEILHEDAIIDPTDRRESPRYQISYKQTVGTEDTFLGLGDVTPASFDCTHIIIKIHFPGSTMKDLDVDVKKNRIKAESKTLKLFTYLPVSVHHDKGNAKFDPKKEVLIVTLPIDNELDS